MPRCLNQDETNNCFWADYDTDSGTHVIVHEPDYLRMRSPKEAPPMIRIMQQCGMGHNHWRMGQCAENGCPKWLDHKDQSSRLEAISTALRESVSAKSPITTGRTALPEKPDLLTYLQLMIEDSKLAYDWLTDVYSIIGHDPRTVFSLFAILNDMNIRGRQLDTIIQKWFEPYPNYRTTTAFADAITAFQAALAQTPDEIVAYVNDNFDRSDVEQAVTHGAARYGHIPLAK